MKRADFNERFALEQSVAAAGAMFARKLGGTSAPEFGVLVAIQMAAAILGVRHWWRVLARARLPVSRRRWAAVVDDASAVSIHDRQSLSRFIGAPS